MFIIVKLLEIEKLCERFTKLYSKFELKALYLASKKVTNSIVQKERKA